MSARPPIIDADGHILDREQDVRRYLQPPWDRRPGPLFPLDQPWDTSLFGKLPATSLPPELTYRHGLSPEEQVALWHRIMEAEGIECQVGEQRTFWFDNTPWAQSDVWVHRALAHRAREILVRRAKRHGLALRQSYARVGKFALIKHQRYAHAKQFKRANRALRTLRTYLGRVIRDIARKLRG